MSPVDNAAIRIASAIPGRIRVQSAIRGISAHAALQEAANRIAHLPAVTDVAPIPDSGSLVVRYAPNERDLNHVVRDVRTAFESALGATFAGASAAHEQPENRTAIMGARTNGATRAGRAPAPSRVLHQIPGRIRLRVPGLRGRPEIAARLEHDLAVKPGMESVEIQPEAEFVILRYDPKAFTPTDLVKLVDRQFGRELTRKLPDNEFHVAADLKPHEPPKINPLLLPTVAFGVAAVETAPVALAAGALAIAALPIVSRAFQGFRRSCLTTEQFDVVTLGLLVSQGNYLAGGMLTWLVALADLTRRNTREHVRTTLSQWKASEKRRPGFLAWEDEAAQRAETVPLSDTETHTGAARTSNRFSGPMFGLAVTDYLLTRDPSRVIGILKPRCEFETSLQFAAPASVLTSITTAAQSGVLFNGGKAMEKLARVEAVVYTAGRGAPEPLSRALADRCIAFESDAGAVPDLQMRGRAVAVVVDRASRAPELDPDVVTVVLARPGDAVEDDAAVVLADEDPLRLIYAIDLAREATGDVRKTTRLLGGAAFVNVATTLLGVSPAPLSTLINTGATLTAAMNAVRPPKLATGAATGTPAPLPPPPEER